MAIAVLYERLGNPVSKDDVDLIHTPSDQMAADIFTKAFSSPESWAAALDNSNIFDTTNGLEMAVKARVAKVHARQQGKGIQDDPPVDQKVMKWSMDENSQDRGTPMFLPEPVSKTEVEDTTSLTNYGFRGVEVHEGDKLPNSNRNRDFTRYNSYDMTKPGPSQGTMERFVETMDKEIGKSMDDRYATRSKKKKSDRKPITNPLIALDQISDGNETYDKTWGELDSTSPMRSPQGESDSSTNVCSFKSDSGYHGRKDAGGL